MDKQYLNLGCGNRYHSAWTNMDLTPRGPGILVHDLSKGFPFKEASYDVVYHSHLLEHLPRSAALSFMKECHRVLKPKGILRVVVPDLEGICRLYLQKLDGALSGEKTSASDYEWMMLEMYDQAVRERPGGEMMTYMSQNVIPNEAFVCSRIGEEAREIIRALKAPRAEDRPSVFVPSVGGDRLTSKAYHLLLRFRKILTRMAYSLCLGSYKLKALQIGVFRLKGEVHQWMYDRYSLSNLMLRAGFEEPRIASSTHSKIPDWASFNLDTLPDGTVIRPDSLFMEGVKPSATECSVEEAKYL